MATAPDSPIVTDGTTSFSGGVDSLKVSTVASVMNPLGIRRDQQCWLINSTVRDGGISPRWGWQPKCRIADGTALYQRGYMYRPISGYPYLVLGIGGHLYKVEPDTCAITDLSMLYATGGGSTTIVTVTGTLYVVLKRAYVSGDSDGKGHIYPAGSDPTIGSFSEFEVPFENYSVTVKLTAPYTGPVGPGNNITLPESGYDGHVVIPAITYEIVEAGGFTITTYTVSPDPMLMPEDRNQFFYEQAEQFLIIQAGDMVTLPLFWDGSFLRRSIGINNTTIAAGTPSNWQDANQANWGNEIPAAGPMCYYMGRLWYAQGRFYSAGDMVGGVAGTSGYDYRDAVLNVTENPLVLGGDGFAVPSESGDIVGMKYMGNINTAQGQGQLYVFTRRAVYALTVPVTRTDWINANSSNQPYQSVVQLVNGGVNDDSIVSVNGDLYFQSYDGTIRSLVAAMRYFQQPGNIPISANENRILALNDHSLLWAASGIEFDNRLLMTSVPFSVPCGVAHCALVPMDFLPVSSFNEQYSPIWEGEYRGVDILQLFTGDFDGKQRAFATVSSRADGSIWLWELTSDNRRENGDQRVDWQIELPAFTWGHVEQLKRLLSGEVWLDNIYGVVEISVDYRVDGENCWVPWLGWKECFARDSNEFKEVKNDPYPVRYSTGYAQTVSLPAPPTTCSHMSRPSNVGYQFQPRITIKGECRLRGFLLHAVEVRRRLYQTNTCHSVDTGQNQGLYSAATIDTNEDSV